MTTPINQRLNSLVKQKVLLMKKWFSNIYIRVWCVVSFFPLTGKTAKRQTLLHIIGKRNLYYFTYHFHYYYTHTKLCYVYYILNYYRELLRKFAENTLWRQWSKTTPYHTIIYIMFRGFENGLVEIGKFHYSGF